MPSVSLRVVGAGLGRTGTASLKVALERLLGGRCYHMSEVLADPEHQFALWAPVLRGDEVDWEKIFAGFVASVDFPGAGYWREISAAFPDALVILSTRPAEAWYRSAASTIFQLDPSPFSNAWHEHFVFNDQFEDPEVMIAAYERHNALVRSTVPPYRFVEWTLGDGWTPLCERLTLPVPEEPFPWTNTAREFRSHNGLE